MTASPGKDVDHGAVAAGQTPPEQAWEAAARDPAAHRTLAAAKRADGDELGALAHLIAAQTLEAYANPMADPHADYLPARSVAGLCDVATGYFMKGDHATSTHWYQLVLLIEPETAIAYQNLAAMHAEAGRADQAAACRERAYRIQRVYVESAGDPAHRVLILLAGRTAGNVPVETLLPTANCCRIKYAIDYADDDEDERLPGYDVVFNAIGEPDVATPMSARLERFAGRCPRPLLNPPSAVALTQRQRMAALLGDLADVVLPPCLRQEGPPESPAALAASLAQGGIVFPVLTRPAASHGGLGLVRCDTLEALWAKLVDSDGACYLSAFHDCRCADGYYRKYRMVFVDRQAFPYHLAISSQWMVHYFSADMEAGAWRLEEERRFLQNPRAALGERAMAAIATIGGRLDLDYAGVDFTLLPDGRVLVFEANATMLVHRERGNGPLAHKNVQVQAIVEAFQDMLARRRLQWDGQRLSADAKKHTATP